MPAILKTLMTEIDALSYPQRMQLLAIRARELNTAGTLPGLLDECREGTVFERRIGLFMATVTGNSSAVETAFDDPDWLVRRQAVRASRHVAVDPEALVRLLDDAPLELRREVYRLLRSQRMTALADRLVETVGDHEAARLLPACSAEVVAAKIPTIWYAVTNWPALARIHPNVMLEEAQRQLSNASAQERREWWIMCGEGVMTAGRVYPQRTFQLLERYPVSHVPAGLARVLARVEPRQVLQLLMDPDQEQARHTFTSRPVLERLSTLPTSDLAAFVRRYRPGLRGLLKTIPPSRRAELCTQVWDEPAKQVDRSTWDLLPYVMRTELAKQILLRPDVREDEADTLAYSAYLPFEEAQPVLERATRRHLAEDRATAYELLIACAGRSRNADNLTQALGTLSRLRNEQDPVRARALTALATLPPHLFVDEQADMLAELTDDTVTARDASWQSRQALGTLAVRLLAGDCLLDWVTSTLDKMFGTVALPSFGRLDGTLRRGQERAFVDAIKPWLEAGMARGHFEPLFAVTRALRGRAWRLPELQELLARAASSRNQAHVASQAIDLWLADPAHRADRVETVLLDDSSTVALSIVWSCLSRTRTDLLDLVLSGKSPAGKHLAAGIRWVPHFAPRIDRWLPRQQRSYVDLLTKIAGDAGTPVHSRAAAIRQAGFVPVYGWSLVDKYCGSPNTTLEEAALGALIWTDRPAEALPILLAHADNDRARVAVYAICRAARFVAPSVLAPILTSLLTESKKVTSRKEAVRLLSTFCGGEAMTVVWGQSNLHRDVKVAVIHAAQSHLDDLEAWRVLQEATIATEAPVALAVASIRPWQLPERHRPGYAALVAALCRHPEPSVAWQAPSAYPAWARWAPLIFEDLSEAVCDLSRRRAWRPSAVALVSLLDRGFELDRLSGVVTTLLNNDELPDAEVDRDRPARQRLVALTGMLDRWAGDQPQSRDLSGLDRLGRTMAEHPRYLHAAFSLLVPAVRLDGEHAEQMFHALDAIGQLAEGRPLAAHHAATVITQHIDHATTALSVVANRFADRGDLVGGFLALGLLHRDDRHDANCRNLLRKLRRHPEIEVQQAALTHVTERE